MLDGMTNIKASEVLKEIKYYTEDLPPYSPDEVAEALEMAIKALEAQPQNAEDCISRKQAMDDKGLSEFHRYDDYIKMRNYLKSLPSVKPKYTDEEIDKAQAVEQAYVDKMVELAVEETKRPKGKWILNDYQGVQAVGYLTYHCSECGREISSKYHGKLSLLKEYPYCHCGAEMGGGEDEVSD